MIGITRARVVDFGFRASESPYHFAVLHGARTVRIVERFSNDGGDAVSAPIEKACLSQERWSCIQRAAAEVFNQRLRREGVKAAQWRARETLLSPHFGKELTLLAWAVELADPTLIVNILSNWIGHAPEERWWLYTTANATFNHPDHGSDRGWRKAIRIAFSENPAAAASPSLLRADVRAVTPRRASAPVLIQQRLLSATA